MQFDTSGLSIDVQPSVNANALVILVTGKLKVKSSNEELIEGCPDHVYEL